MSSVRGQLVKPDPTKTDVCERPGCGHPEGDHLRCGCAGTVRGGSGCECPGFGVVHRCQFCGAPFAAAWRRAAHELTRSADCRREEAQLAAAAARGFKPKAVR